MESPKQGLFFLAIRVKNILLYENKTHLLYMKKEEKLMEFLVYYFTIFTLEIVAYTTYKYVDKWMMEEVEDCN